MLTAWKVDMLEEMAASSLSYPPLVASGVRGGAQAAGDGARLCHDETGQWYQTGGLMQAQDAGGPGRAAQSE